MKKILIIFVFILVLSNHLFFKTQENYPLSDENTILLVQITGEIQLPGTYQIKKGSRVYELIKCAGGTLPKADLTNLNLNEIINKDSYHIKAFLDDKEENHFRYNLNFITYEQLITIPNITSNRALEIILYRKEHSFLTVTDLLKVKGIGEKTYEKIKDYFYI